MVVTIARLRRGCRRCCCRCAGVCVHGRGSGVLPPSSRMLGDARGVAAREMLLAPAARRDSPLRDDGPTSFWSPERVTHAPSGVPGPDSCQRRPLPCGRQGAYGRLPDDGDREARGDAATRRAAGAQPDRPHAPPGVRAPDPARPRRRGGGVGGAGEVESPEDVQFVFERGLEHERKYLESLKAAGKSVVEIDGGLRRRGTTSRGGRDRRGDAPRRRRRLPGHVLRRRLGRAGRLPAPRRDAVAASATGRTRSPTPSSPGS